MVVVCLGAPVGVFGWLCLFKVGWDWGSGTPAGFFVGGIEEFRSKYIKIFRKFFCQINHKMVIA